MDFSKKEIERAVRDFNRIVSEISESSLQTYKSRAISLIDLIKTNNVIHTILSPYLELDIDHDAITIPDNGWFSLNLPSNADKKIAYSLQVLDSVAAGETDIEMYTHAIFRQKKLLDNVILWNNEILFPCFRLLDDKLRDLIEDEVEGHDTVNTDALQIINIGTITNTTGNIAVGQGNTQTLTSTMNNLSSSIIETALKDHIINEDQTTKLKSVTDELENELSKSIPEKGKLEKIVGVLFDIGSKSLIKIASNIASSPEFTTAIASFFMS